MYAGWAAAIAEPSQPTCRSGVLFTIIPPRDAKRDQRDRELITQLMEA